MSLDTVLAVLGLVLPISQIAAGRRGERHKIIRNGIPLALMALIGLFLTHHYVDAREQQARSDAYQHQLAVVENDVMEHTKTLSTFDDVYEKTYYPDFDVLNEAIDDLTSKGVLMSVMSNFTDAKGLIHTVRMFCRTRN